ncbi:MULTISPECIES: CPBP family glutamic-type intramembrane protease [Bacillus cereus group]|uniref:CPBP family intramembrane metalloprotease n=1 Tax=Bacillus thuringiensis serovar toumanoffi TaxID=180862 RepID=A0ABD5HRW7_BACTU|nr:MULTISPECIES: CPBP family glutamic-type intramembrane protease [Bacillus cereus group]EEM92329.1 CAAX amino terminal protease [Bacillus thuringiensis IBL 200]MCR6784535.1 CPBP family glutamic-type intramembrane protease [Bacillus thuringiensis]MCR6863181.1 CPBP family glutamic-type intramembrane protease [Bacillus thuringiensis]MCR6869437.1 CPBP family glutamic-type intramembrane protease [Bacillus thuringiensis]MDW9207669.1 CPBP family intramembrane metalloprotease [Bacillus thuringiensis 
MLKKINRFMFSLSTIWFILFILLGTFLVIIPLNLFLPEIQKNPIMEDSIIVQILLGVVVGPIYETFIFQVFLFWVLSFIPFIKDRDYLIILIASIVFGLNHFYGITYVVGTTMIGFLYNYCYWVYQKKNEKNQVKLSAIGIVFIIHLLHNVITIIAANL